MIRLFDAQADSMLTLIDAQLQRMEINHPNERIVSSSSGKNNRY